MSNEFLPPDSVNNVTDLFQYLYGIRPKKDGTAAELLYYIISKINNLNTNDIEYSWNQKIKLYNNNNIQIDIIEKIAEKYLKIVEVKDWNKNVNRQAVQNIESTTSHLEKEYDFNDVKASVVSTHGFSNGAKEWARNSYTKYKINLSIMRLTEDIDLKDKILKFNVKIYGCNKIDDINFKYSDEDIRYNSSYLKNQDFNFDCDLHKIKLLNSNDTLYNLVNNKYDEFLPDKNWIKNEKEEYTINVEEKIVIEYNENVKFKASGITFIKRPFLMAKTEVTKGRCFIALCDENNKLLELFFEDELKKYKTEVLNLLNND